MRMGRWRNDLSLHREPASICTRHAQNVPYSHISAISTIPASRPIATSSDLSSALGALSAHIGHLSAMLPLPLLLPLSICAVAKSAVDESPTLLTIRATLALRPIRRSRYGRFRRGVGLRLSQPIWQHRQSLSKTHAAFVQTPAKRAGAGAFALRQAAAARRRPPPHTHEWCLSGRRECSELGAGRLIARPADTWPTSRVVPTRPIHSSTPASRTTYASACEVAPSNAVAAATSTSTRVPDALARRVDQGHTRATSSSSSSPGAHPNSPRAPRLEQEPTSQRAREACRCACTTPDEAFFALATRPVHTSPRGLANGAAGRKLWSARRSPQTVSGAPTRTHPRPASRAARPRRRRARAGSPGCTARWTRPAASSDDLRQHTATFDGRTRSADANKGGCGAAAAATGLHGARRRRARACGAPRSTPRPRRPVLCTTKTRCVRYSPLVSAPASLCPVDWWVWHKRDESGGDNGVAAAGNVPCGVPCGSSCATGLRLELGRE
ncbi:hypothetical protein VTO73DRAFT_6966 [Trametes versicolor]